MTALILHHYPLSPYAEKIRAMLGFSGLAWQSVITREMPPRPLLATLAGGYRRIPVAQVGADVFCDTRIIASEIAALGNQPRLAFEGLSADEQAYVLDVDSRLFFACVMAGSTRATNRKMMQSLSVLNLMRLLWDRINMGRKASGPAVSFTQAKPLVLAHLADLEQRLSGDWLSGDHPSLVDFSVYHGLWFVRDIGECAFMNDFPNILAWLDRIKAFGHGQSQSLSGEAAVQIAVAATPRDVPEQAQQDSLIGSTVTIAPADYGQIPTRGELVGSLPTRWIVARDVAGAGRVHVHFPKQGYAIAVL